MDVKNYWDKKHRKYLTEDWINKPTVFAQSAVNYFPNKGRLLDLGAGQGQDSRYFSSLGYYVVSSDFSDKVLQISKETSIKEGVNLEFKNVDLSKPLPFGDNEFDIVYSHLALHYFDHETTQKLFAEIYRVLRPGGVFATIFNTIEDPEISGSKKIDDDLYEVDGIIKRYFSLDYIEKSVSGKFEAMIMDKKGETYKNKIKSLIRFIGKKV